MLGENRTAINGAADFTLSTCQHHDDVDYEEYKRRAPDEDEPTTIISIVTDNWSGSVFGSISFALAAYICDPTRAPILSEELWSEICDRWELYDVGVWLMELGCSSLT